MTSFTEPGAAPGDTMNTLDEIMGKSAGSGRRQRRHSAAQVLAGKTYWSLRSGGEWGPKTGMAAVGSDVSGGDRG